MTIDIAAFLKFFLLLIRASFIVFFAPVIGSRLVPSVAKIALSAFLAFMAYHLITINNLNLYIGTFALVILIFKEMIIGMSIGFVSRLVFDGIQFGGQYIGYMMGFAVVNVLDPQSEAHMPIISQFENIIAILIFLAIGGHLWFFSAFCDSFSILPVGYKLQSLGWISYIAHLFGSIFVIAIKVNAPIFLVLFLIQLVMAVIARVVPQMNIFMVGFPVQIALGFFLLFISLKAMGFLFTDTFYNMKIHIYTLMRLISGR